MAETMNPVHDVSKKYDENLKTLKEQLGIGKSYDIALREFRIGGKKAALIFRRAFGAPRSRRMTAARLRRGRRGHPAAHPETPLQVDRVDQIVRDGPVRAALHGDRKSVV